jgi:hypothetical protein
MSALCSDEVPPKIFECDLDRDEAGIPPNYMLRTSGVLLAGKDMLIAIGDVPGAPDPSGWTPASPPVPENANYQLCGTADFEKPSRDGGHMLRAKRFGEFWAAERSTKFWTGRLWLREIHMLVFAFGEIPIWTRSPQAAMRLAEYCDPIPDAPVAGFWLPMFSCT